MEKLNILVVGGGGREHALLWKLSQSPQKPKLHIAPGNDGLKILAQTYPEIASHDIFALKQLAQKIKADLVVIGPEIPLTMGLADELKKIGIKVFGPSAKAAQIEGSKIFSKNLMKKYNLPTAQYEIFYNLTDADNYLKKADFPLVIKADGLAAGKGVIICPNLKEAQKALNLMFTKKEFGSAGEKIIIEEFLEGEEVSCLAWVDGEIVIPMPSAQDHKALYDNDIGPNTGGMGAYSPAPIVTKELEKEILEKILKPTALALKNEGCYFNGILYAGLMLTKKGPMLLEFNARFGDPEAQPLLMRLKTDLLEILVAMAENKLENLNIIWDDRPTACVVMSSAGYPGIYESGFEIKGLKEAANIPETMVFLAGVKEDPKKSTTLLTNGGRVLAVSALGNDLPQAIKKAYQAIDKISWQKAYYRQDIGSKALKHLKEMALKKNDY